MANDEGGDGARGPLPGWAPPPGRPGLGPPGPPGYPGGTPVPWGAPPPKRRFGVGALVGMGLGGVLAGILLTFGGIAVLYAIVGDQARHPAVGTYGPIGETAEQPTTGDCLSARPSLADVTTDDEVVPCEERHRSEVIGVAEIPSLDVAPSRTRLDLFVSEACSLSFRSYTGRNPDTAQVGFGAVVPDEDAWAAGERRVWCLAESTDVDDGVGSMRRER